MVFCQTIFAKLQRGRDTDQRSHILSAFLQASGFASYIAQIVKLCPADFCPTDNFDFFDARAFQQEGSLDTYPMAGNAPHCEIGVVATAAQPDYNPLENLDTFAISFDNANVNLNRIAWGNLRVAAIFSLQRFYKVDHDKSFQTQKNTPCGVSVIRNS
jgi:hypothetical protein